jgi:alkaline phosphatase
MNIRPYRWKNFFVGAMILILMVAGVYSGAAADQGTAAVKNVIMMVPDGCSISIETLARWLEGQDLTLDGMLAGAVKTYAINSVITGSAAAATAFSTGHKTTVGFLGIGPRPDDILSTLPEPDQDLRYRPLATVLEGARLAGKATGLVATCAIAHATPAAFGAHVPSREQFDDIMEQLVYGGIDVALGGGHGYLLPRKSGGRRADGENLLEVLQERGCRFVATKEEMAAVHQGKLWGLFAEKHLHPDIDRAEFAPHEPSLAEMTAKAIELLAQDPDGFFLLVEGSQVDWAGHTNDPIYMVTDFLAFDQAVRVAVEFAAGDGHTLVLAFPDHNCGGLSIGSEYAAVNYTSTTVEDLLNPLRRMSITSAGLEEKIGRDRSPERIREMVAEWWGLNLTDADMEQIHTAMSDRHKPLDETLCGVVSRNHTVLGWTTHGHAGEDVPLWTYGPGKPAGLIDNTELAGIAARAMGFDLEQIGDRLFVEASEAFPDSDVRIDKTDRNNPMVLIGPAQLPANKNILHIGEQERPLEGLVIYIPNTNKAYLPRQAVEMIRMAE